MRAAREPEGLPNIAGKQPTVTIVGSSTNSLLYVLTNELILKYPLNQP